MTHALPIAAGIDWIETLLPVLFVAFWLISQVVAFARRLLGPAENAEPPRRPPADVGRPAIPAVGRPRPDAGGADVQGEIREFLERQGRQVSKPSAPKPQPLKPPSPKTRQPSVAPGPATPPAPVGSRIASQVAADFAKQLDHLSSPLTSGHVVPSAAPGPARAAGGSGEEGLVAMLRSPATLRQLVVLREILDRPVDRW